MNELIWRRLVAYIIDEMIVVIPVNIISIILVSVTGSGLIAMLMNLVMIGSLWYYFFFMETSAKFGHNTFGKKILGIKTQTENGQPMEKKTAMIRAAWKLIGIESVSIFFTKEKKTFHDVMAKTDVVKA